MKRLNAVDLLRGIVMLLMIVDHTRVYSGIPAGGPQPAVFFTRWITHFCAPWFAFLAGTSAFLAGQRPGAPALWRWLVRRGLVLIVLEFTVMRLGWTFNLRFDRYLLMGVLWMLGACMVLMAAIVQLPLAAIVTLGLVVIVAHPCVNLVPYETFSPALAGAWGPVLRVLYFGGGITLGGTPEPNLIVLYSLIPWIGVMACGYAFGRVLTWPEARRNRLCVGVGGAALAAWLVLRGTQGYGDWPWRSPNSELPPVFAFLNASKYPASLHFLLMTLGPGLLAWPWLERARGRVVDVISVYGRAPLVFYVLHIPLVHLLALAVCGVRSPAAMGWLFADHPMRSGPPPSGYAWPLPLLYAVAAFGALLLYFPCRAVARRKETAGG